MFYLHFQDLADAYVGPFETRREMTDHVAFVANRGDGAVLMGVTETVPAGEFVLSPAKDRAWTHPADAIPGASA